MITWERLGEKRRSAFIRTINNIIRFISMPLSGQNGAPFCRGSRTQIQDEDDLIQVLKSKYISGLWQLLTVTFSQHWTVPGQPSEPQHHCGGHSRLQGRHLTDEASGYIRDVICRIKGTLSLSRSWWMCSGTRSRRSRASWSFTSTRIGSQAPLPGHSGAWRIVL